MTALQKCSTFPVNRFNICTYLQKIEFSSKDTKTLSVVWEVDYTVARFLLEAYSNNTGDIFNLVSVQALILKMSTQLK